MAHHGLEDDSIFPYLLQSATRASGSSSTASSRSTWSSTTPSPRSTAPSSATSTIPEDYTQIQAAIDLLTDSLLSHLSYEEFEIVEPLARYGFYPGQL